MCGVIAKYAPGGSNRVSAQDLAAALKALHHRGPDSSGQWISPDAQAGLAHARLSIIGLNNGAQPISSEDGQIQIVVNGELYDFERIREELRARGHKFATESDSEIALHLYREFGVDCLQHLRGEFAIIIWDERSRRLFAARDRFGIKPLVYAQYDGQLFLASEAKALFAMGLPAEWDEESFFQAANMQYTLPHRTLFKHVNQLEPGKYLLAHEHNVQTVTYWDMNYGRSEPVSKMSEADMIEGCREQLEEAVRFRMRADIPVCAHLSGGLDSSAVVALAMRVSNNPVQCFSVSFEEESYDERELAGEMAKKAGAEFHPVRVSQADLIAHLSDAVYYSEGLAVNGHLTAKYILNKEIRRNGYKVALTGEGSDEVLAGYAHLRSDLFKTDGRDHLLADLHASNKASQGIMLMHGQTLALKSVEEKLGYIPGFLEAKGSFGHKMCGLLNERYANQFADYDAYDRFVSCFDIDGQLAKRNHVYQSLYLWTKSALANYILRTLGDGMEMANSVEGRLPFLDHHFFEYIRDLPLSMKINGTTEKYVLKEALKPYITENIYKRQKHPFVAPPVSAFATESAKELLNDSLRGKAFAQMPFFDQKKVVALLENLPNLSEGERAALDPVFMMMVSASCLQSRFNL